MTRELFALIVGLVAVVLGAWLMATYADELAGFDVLGFALVVLGVGCLAYAGGNYAQSLPSIAGGA